MKYHYEVWQDNKCVLSSQLRQDFEGYGSHEIAYQMGDLAAEENSLTNYTVKVIPIEQNKD